VHSYRQAAEDVMMATIRSRISGLAALAAAVGWLLLAPGAGAQQELRQSLFAGADAAIAAAQAADAPLLAPVGYRQAMNYYADAEQDFSRGRNLDRIRTDLAEVVRLLNQAIDSAEIAKITLASLLKTRDDARNAESPTFASELWLEAEESFAEAVERLEYGNIRQQREASGEAEALYRDAELTAIKAQYLSQTRAELALAEQERAPRYAPETYQRALELLELAETALNENRYDTDEPRSIAQQARYEASHARYLAEQIELVDDGELTTEALILRYEEPLTRIAAAADRVAPLDSGTAAITEELIVFIEELRENAQQSDVDLADARTRIAELEDEIRELDQQLGGVSQERVALVQRLEAEARIREQFASIETLFDREEARVSREANILVIRLVGLTFASGSAGIEPEHRSLLEKVARAAGVFPRSEIVIEGHTDSYGSDDNNMLLSQDRADAVREFLTDQFQIPQFRITAEGYGETQPIANNETPQGRARNRRIDVRIEPELQ
jgi:outer membrane protein OmpA-like peptidoglycan-associated protein